MTENKIVCPFCQQELDTEDYYVLCNNPHCKATAGMSGTEELWQELDRWKQSAEDHQQWLRTAEKRLETTRKALDVALDALKKIDNTPLNSKTNAFSMAVVAEKAIKQINEIKGNKQ